MTTLNGSQSTIKALIASDISICFGNPGTSEMHFLAALDQIKGIRCVLGLHESIVTGAADGYYRLSGKPAVTLLHLAPGLANGLSNLHNAKKANSGILNIVGEHATYHLKYDAPLSGDTEGVARPMSHWVKTSTSADTVAHDAALAASIAKEKSGQIATLILPADVSWLKTDVVAQPVEPKPLRKVEASVVQAIAKVIQQDKNTVMLLGGAALRGKALEFAGKIAEKTGCRILSEGQNARIERGHGRVSVNRLPFDVKGAQETLKGTEHLILVGAKVPIAFFAYPNLPSLLMPESCEALTLATHEDQVERALEDLMLELGAHNTLHKTSVFSQGPMPTGVVNSDRLGQFLGACLPENAIVVDEAVSTGRGFFKPTEHARAHDWLNSMGSSLGYALPVAIGCAVAQPDRPVIALVGDGSAMFSVQALWTMARENLNIKVLIFANHAYKILKNELVSVGLESPTQTALSMLSLNSPNLDWVSMAKAHGVEGFKVENIEALVKTFNHCLTQTGTQLIQIEM